MTLKRCFDVVIAALLLLALLPLILVIAIAVAVGSGRPVLFRAYRVGRGGSTFPMLKFRTMKVGASGPAITGRNDPRITRVGAVLRRSKLDELPQLLNVLSGDMSLVGPRPEDGRFVARYTAQQREVLTVRPGMTSPAAILYRDEEKLLAAGAPNFEHLYETTIMAAKLTLDLDYIRKRNFWRDIVILYQSVAVVLRPRRAEELPTNAGS